MIPGLKPFLVINKPLSPPKGIPQEKSLPSAKVPSKPSDVDKLSKMQDVLKNPEASKPFPSKSMHMAASFRHPNGQT